MYRLLDMLGLFNIPEAEFLDDLQTKDLRAFLLAIPAFQSAKLFLKSSELGLPNPSPAGEGAPLPLVPRGKGHTCWRDRGWESPNSDEGTYTVVLYKYMYFAPWDFYFFKLTQPFTVLQCVCVHCKGEREETWWKTTPTYLWFKKSIQKPQVWELSRLCPETWKKLHIREFGQALRETNISWGFC